MTKLVRPAIKLAHRAVEQKGLPADDADLLAQRFEPNAADLLAIDENPAGRQFVESREQIDQGRFAGAGWPDQRDPFAGAGMQRNVFQRHAIGRVAEADVFKNHFALDGEGIQSSRFNVQS